MRTVLYLGDSFLQSLKSVWPSGMSAAIAKKDHQQLLASSTRSYVVSQVAQGMTDSY